MVIVLGTVLTMWYTNWVYTSHNTHYHNVTVDSHRTDSKILNMLLSTSNAYWSIIVDFQIKHIWFHLSLLTHSHTHIHYAVVNIKHNRIPTSPNKALVLATVYTQKHFIETIMYNMQKSLYSCCLCALQCRCRV